MSERCLHFIYLYIDYIYYSRMYVRAVSNVYSNIIIITSTLSEQSQRFFFNRKPFNRLHPCVYIIIYIGQYRWSNVRERGRCVRMTLRSASWPRVDRTDNGLRKYDNYIVTTSIRIISADETDGYDRGIQRFFFLRLVKNFLKMDNGNPRCIRISL